MARLILIVAAFVPPLWSETLPNGIVLPPVWPPRDVVLDAEPPETPPYLVSPPAVVPIDLGRQLFVDYFLIESTTLRRTFHAAEPYAGNPVLRPDRPWEKPGPPPALSQRVQRRPQSRPYSDGVWYDPADRLFKAWYLSGANTRTLYATSEDGITWEKPALDVEPGTNVVHHAPHRDSSTVWLDHSATDPARRFKFVYSTGHNKPLALHESPDGIHWGAEVARSPDIGDRTTIFWNPFRRVWVLSLKLNTPGRTDAQRYKVAGTQIRNRVYREHADLASALQWREGDLVPWVGADRLDASRIDLPVRTELYNLDAVAYESLFIGLFSIWRGQPDRDVRWKPNDVVVGYSRDGFHWYRPDRTALLAVSEQPEAWNYGNVQSVGGGCLVVGDRLYFYMSGRSGPPNGPGDDTTGLATLRRDGFVSMNAGDMGGTLTTRPVSFRGRHLFVNVDSVQGELRVEVLDEKGGTIAPFAAAACIPVRADNTLQEIRWNGVADLSTLAGRAVRFRFHLRAGALYSFWVSADRSGASQGFVGAGGPGFTGPVDSVGRAIYRTGGMKKVLN